MNSILIDVWLFVAALLFALIVGAAIGIIVARSLLTQA